MLQTRSAKRTAAAAVKIAVAMVDEGLIDKREAVTRIEPSQVDQLLRDQFEPSARKAARRIAGGLKLLLGNVQGAGQQARQLLLAVLHIHLDAADFGVDRVEPHLLPVTPGG